MPLGGHSKLKRAYPRPERGLSRIKWTGKDQFHYWGAVTVDQWAFLANFTLVARALAARVFGHHENMLSSAKTKLRRKLPTYPCFKSDKKITSNILRQNCPFFYENEAQTLFPFL